jgi:hypothetical protein
MSCGSFRTVHSNPISNYTSIWAPSAPSFCSPRVGQVTVAEGVALLVWLEFGDCSAPEAHAESCVQLCGLCFGLLQFFGFAVKLHGRGSAYVRVVSVSQGR